MKVVSLVPSLTESVLELGFPATSLVGRTSWCIHPELQLRDVPALGGTKTPNLKRIASLQPDLVILEKEENPLEVYEWLQAEGIEAWVAHVTSVADVPPMLRELGGRLDCKVRAAEFADRIAESLARAENSSSPASTSLRAVPLIWHDPLMSLSPTRYGGDLVARAGFEVLDLVPGEGYPVVTPEQIGQACTEHLLLTSEPHPFTAAEGEAIVKSIAHAGFAPPQCHLVDGEALTWFGTRTLSAVRWWLDFRARLLA